MFPDDLRRLASVLADAIAVMGLTTLSPAASPAQGPPVPYSALDGLVLDWASTVVDHRSLAQVGRALVEEAAGLYENSIADLFLL